MFEGIHDFRVWWRDFVGFKDDARKLNDQIQNGRIIEAIVFHL